MKLWRLGAAILLAAIVAGCGGNSTPVGITVTGAGVAAGSTVTIVVNGNEQFTASVSGTSTSTVYWQICLPARCKHDSANQLHDSTGSCGMHAANRGFDRVWINHSERSLHGATRGSADE